MHIRMKLLVVLVVLSGLCLLASCNPNTDEPGENGGQPGTQQGAQQNMLQAPQNAVEDSQKVAERLADLAADIEQVNQATAVALGQWAVVGIDVEEHLDRSEVGLIKHEVSEALQGDPVGAFAIVSADPDIMARLQAMNEDMQDGQPVEGVMEELAGIVARLMPQAPRNITEQPANS